MDAFLFTIILLSFFGIVGFATITLFPPRLPILQGVLIAPAIGISVTVLAVFFINRAGVPVKEFGGLISISLLILSISILAIKRPLFPLRRVLPFAGVVLFGLLLAAWPMFLFGFDWISFTNDDMANYSLGAQRFFENGFFAPPDLKAFFQGRDYSQVYWFLAPPGTRTGSELLLANVWAATGINPHRAFMPVVFSLHAALILASGAMATSKRLPRKAALVTAVLVALSPMTTLGALYQLIAQVGGLTLLCSAAILLLRPLPRTSVLTSIRGNVAAVLLVACLFVYYPEVLPFLGLGWVIFIGLTMLHSGKDPVPRILVQAIVVGIALLLLLNFYLFDSVSYILMQMAGGVNKNASGWNVLFPYFLIPDGLPAVWGLIPIPDNLSEPLRSLAIVIGAFAFLIFLRVILAQAKKPPSIALSLCVGMLLVGGKLFISNSDFGLFKLIMFAQPFVMCVIAAAVAGVAWSDVSRWRKTAVFGALTAAIITQAGYVKISTGEVLGSFANLPHASRDGLIRQFADRFAKIIHPGRTETLGTSHMVLAKLQSLYTYGVPTVFTSKQFYSYYIDGYFRIYLSRHHRKDPLMDSYYNERAKYVTTHSIKTAEGINSFEVPIGIPRTQKSLDLQPGKLDIFNRYGRTFGAGDYFSEVGASDNVLEFIHSDLGQHYYGAKSGKVSIYALEQDPMFPGREFSLLGRHFVFMTATQELHPRVVMELSSTITKQFQSALPNPLVQGLSMGFVGRGSARVFSRPIDFTYIDGSKFLAVDMSRKASFMPENKRGLMLLYGRDIPLDSRQATTFGRDISLVPEKAYQALVPPSKLSEFPRDLANNALEYSGIYEDGWISEKSFFVLSAQPESKFLSLKGSIPEFKDSNFSSTLKISIDGKKIAEQKIGMGGFEIKLPVEPDSGRHRVDLEFDRYQILPGEDGRPASAKMDFIGYVDE